MEIPEISMISDFEAGMQCFQSPSLISRFLPFSGIEKVPKVYSFWKWGAVVLAILATFSSIIKRLKLLIINIRRIKPSPETLLQHLDVDLDLSDDDDDESLEENSSDDDDDDEPSTSFRYRMSGRHEDFSVKGSFSRYRWQNANLKLRRRHSNGGEGYNLAEFPAGKNVVKLWDSLGLSLGFDDSFEDSDSDGVVSLWDFNKEQKIGDIFGHFPAVTVTAPSRSVILSAAKRGEKNNDVILNAYDTRMRGQIPVAFAQWGRDSAASPANLTSGGIEKVYVRDDGKGVVTIGDMRKFKKPLETLTEDGGDLWWDADGVILDDEFVDCSR
ncbi:hypothetical protein M9H77_08543 [Catharanthus roseus]|uniref:Uncharacterized protein n=1 Tax=Catharanthus roseus TaxID=4058 RepID=A0ACC0BYH8_CATRO|nr:hypothetical protein M9H77_08543 [Catharanthus roseus]